MATHPKNKIRQVKLHGKYRALQNDWRGGKHVPWLNLSGVWLERAGFFTGDHIHIKVGKGRLVITLSEKQRFDR